MSTTLRLEADRALPFPAEQRAIAREIYGETKDLPLICMHGHVEPEVFADDVPFADPAQLLIVPDHYVFRMLASQGIDLAGSACRGPTAAPSRPTPARSGGRSARTGSSSAAPRRATGWSTSWSRSSGSTWSPAPRPPTHLRPDRRPGGRARASGRAPCSTASTSRSSRPPTPRPRTCAHHARLAADGLGERVLPTFRPDALAYLDRPTWRADIAELASVSGIDTATLRRLPGRPASAPRSLRRGGRPGHRPRPPAGRHHPDGADRGPGAVLPGPGRGGAERRPRSTPSPRTCSSRWRRCRCEDGLVMQIHPGVLRDHNTAIWRGATGPDKGYDIPVQYRVHPRAAADAGPVRHRSPVPGHPVHRRRDRLQPGAGPASPAPTLRCGWAPPGGSWTPRRACAGSARPPPRPPASTTPPASWTTPGPSRPSRPATTCPAGSTPATSPGWSWSTG